MNYICIMKIVKKLLIMLFKKSKNQNHRLLFVCNMKPTGPYGFNRTFSGLFNSSRMLSEMLNKQSGIESKIVKVIDSNYINAEIYKYKPTIVVLEALWVPVYKLELLQKMYPSIKWIVRIHSEIPFLANEGNAIRLINEYKKIPNVYIACNSPRAQQDLGLPGASLPNYYPTEGFIEAVNYRLPLNIGCFGSVRPMKNQLLQAISAIKFADWLDVEMNFHMNTSRLEQGGESVMKNIRALFENSRHNLIEHPWMEPPQFKELLGQMHMVMQVSLSETFNIVTADAVSVGVPVVVSPEINWIEDECYAHPNSGRDILNTMEYVWRHKRRLVLRNYFKLKNYSRKAKSAWLSFIRTI